MAKSSNDGCGLTLAVLFVIWVIAAIPKPVWITIGVIAAVALTAWIAKKVAEEREKNRIAAEARERADQAERARRAHDQLIAEVGANNAKRVGRAAAAIKQITVTEAARAGWLGEVDFKPDIRVIVDNFRKAHQLQSVVNQLSALDNAGPDDRKILTEAKATIADLEGCANERAVLIAKCAREAEGIDASLRKEREDARTAEQRAELHAKLSAMLYGIEATPDTTPVHSGADSVLARVQAYREIKNQIRLIRDADPPT